MNDKINILKCDLNSVIKQKLSAERDLRKLRVTANSICDELATFESELEFLTKSLEESKLQVSNAYHQLTMIDICTVSERSKASSHIEHLNDHKEGFNELSDRERVLSEMREMELREKEVEELESERQRQKMAAERSEQCAREAASLDEETAALEQACTVLKKRNNAIMLKLRRKLVETEDSRRELLKLKNVTAN